MTEAEPSGGSESQGILDLANRVTRLREEIEAQIIEQDHRIIPVVTRILQRKSLSKGDPRRGAATKALVYLLLTPATAAFGAGVTGAILALLSYVELRRQNTLLAEQNSTVLERAAIENLEFEESGARSSFFALLPILDESLRTIEANAHSASIDTEPTYPPPFTPRGRLGATAMSALANHSTVITSARSRYELDLIVTSWWRRGRTDISDAMATLHILWNAAERSGEEATLLIQTIRSRIDSSIATLYLLWVAFVASDAAWQNRLASPFLSVYFTDAMEQQTLRALWENVQWYRSDATSR